MLSFQEGVQPVWCPSPGDFSGSARRRRWLYQQPHTTLLRISWSRMSSPMKRVPVTSLESVPLPDGQTLKIEEIQQRKRILQAQIEGLNSQIASAGAVVVSPARRTHIHFAEEQEEAEAVEETEQVEETLTSEDDRRTPGAPTGEVIPEALVVAVESPRGVVTRQETVSPTVLATGLRRPPCL